MLDNCCYNEIKIMHNLSSLIWFIKKHAQQDAQSAHDALCTDFLKQLEVDLCKHAHTLKHMICKEEKVASCSECK